MFRACVPAGVAALLLTSCAPTPEASSAPSVETAELEAVRAVHARHLRLRIAPQATADFEALMDELVQIAETQGLPSTDGWLCYREPSNHWWVQLYSSDPTDSELPTSLAEMVSAIGGQVDDATRTRLGASLAAVSPVPEWSVRLQERPRWGAYVGLGGIRSCARLVIRRFVYSEEEAFDEALVAEADELRTSGYPFPTEGFVVRSGSSNLNLLAPEAATGEGWQVIHGLDDGQVESAGGELALHASERTAEDRERSSAVSATLREATESIDVYDAELRSDLSFISR